MNRAMERPPAAAPLALPLLAAGGIGLAAARLAGLEVPGWSLGLCASAIGATIGVGVAFLGSGIFARPILAGPPGGDRLALTFDDGPDPVHTRRILELLDAAGQRATFFVIGERAAAQPELVAELARRGHGVENHSLRHARTTTFQGASRLAAELGRASSIIEGATGVAPRYFRPPAGLLSPPVVAAARRAGLQLLGWSATARDGTARATVPGSLGRLRRGLRPGAILVLHDGVERGAREPIAPALLPALLDDLAARGLRSVPLRELLA